MMTARAKGGSRLPSSIAPNLIGGKGPREEDGGWRRRLHLRITQRGRQRHANIRRTTRPICNPVPRQAVIKASFQQTSILRSLRREGLTRQRRLKIFGLGLGRRGGIQDSGGL